jgi:hypothetical protein
LALFTVLAIISTVWWLSGRQPAPLPQATPVAGTSSTPAPSSEPVTTSESRASTHIPEALDAPPSDVETTSLDEPAPALADLISRVTPAVVTIQTPSSRGTGFFISSDTIISNVHVVGGESTVAVRRSDGRTVTARVETLSPAFDIAVLKVLDAVPAQSTVQLGTLRGVRIGEEVIAIGTPLGFLQNTVSRGIVSGLREAGGATLVQTDAAINPGNSGGPLLDTKGNVIGVIKSGYVGSNGLSFAVSVDHARAVLGGRTDAAPALPAPPEPYEALSPAVAAPGEQERLNATRAFEETIGQLARRADVLDAQWKSFAAQCYQGRIVGSFERQWFSLWDDRAMQGVVASGCVAYFNDFRRQADEVRLAVVATEEAARRADIYPGVRRDVLQKYRLGYWTD